MSKITKVFNTAYKTKVKNRNKITFLFFFFLTYGMNFSLRKFPFFGNILKNFFSYFPKPEFIIENSIGIWSVSPFNDTMVISSDYFEEHLSNWPGKNLHKRVFIDIGAHIGRYTLLAANKFNYSHILSIEANPVTFNMLKKNISLNRIDKKVIAEQVAVGDKEGEVTLKVQAHHLGGAIVVKNDTHPAINEAKVLVHLTTVNDLISKSGLASNKIDFIKMDVEGMELEVLAGMSKILTNMPDGSGIMIEVSDDLKPVVAILSKYGFKHTESISNDNLFTKIL